MIDLLLLAAWVVPVLLWIALGGDPTDYKFLERERKNADRN